MAESTVGQPPLLSGEQRRAWCASPSSSGRTGGTSTVVELILAPHRPGTTVVNAMRPPFQLSTGSRSNCPRATPDDLEVAVWRY